MTQAHFGNKCNFKIGEIKRNTRRFAYHSKGTGPGFLKNS